VYPADEVARKHNVGVEEETTSGREAYAAFPRSVPDTLPSPELLDARVQVEVDACDAPLRDAHDGGRQTHPRATFRGRDAVPARSKLHAITTRLPVITRATTIPLREKRSTTPAAGSLHGSVSSHTGLTGPRITTPRRSDVTTVGLAAPARLDPWDKRDQTHPTTRTARQPTAARAVTH
jgi:hypothetical protein